jgi:hypothetical protein
VASVWIERRAEAGGVRYRVRYRLGKSGSRKRYGGRRGSLLGKQGYSLAEIAERLGDTKVVTAEHYMYAIGDYAEVDYADLLGR